MNGRCGKHQADCDDPNCPTHSTPGPGDVDDTGAITVTDGTRRSYGTIWVTMAQAERAARYGWSMGNPRFVCGDLVQVTK